MLHQIRKMIGMAIAVVRGDTDDSIIVESWNTDRIDVPRAPGLGLMLEEVFRKFTKRHHLCPLPHQKCVRLGHP